MVYKKYLIRHCLKWEAFVYLGLIKTWYLHRQCLIWIPQISAFSATEKGLPWRQLTTGFSHAIPTNNSHQKWLVFRCYRVNTFTYTGTKFQLRCFHDSMSISSAFYLFSLTILFFLCVFIWFFFFLLWLLIFSLFFV